MTPSEIMQKYEEIDKFVPAKVPVIKISTPFHVSLTRELSSYWTVQIAYCSEEFIIYVIEGKRQLKKFFDELQNCALYVGEITYLL